MPIESGRQTLADTRRIDALRGLFDLLLSMFTPDGLQRFLHFGPEGDRLVSELNFAQAPAIVFYEATRLLDRRGHVTRDLFERLRREFPLRNADIDKVERACLGWTTEVVAATHVITLEATIAGRVSLIDHAQVRAALGSCEPRSWRRIDLNALDPARSDADWSEGQAAIDAAVQDHLRHEVLPSDARHVSIFGLAPIPWLMALGHAVSETVQARLFTRLRVPATWSWQPDEPGLSQWSVRPLATSPDAREVAVLISASARVLPERVDAVLPSADRTTYEIALDDPKIDAVRSEAQLDAFGRVYRATLDQIARKHRSTTQIHVFGAMPVAVAVDCGRRVLHSADPVVVAYHLVGDTYVRALELRR